MLFRPFALPSLIAITSVLLTNVSMRASADPSWAPSTISTHNGSVPPLEGAYFYLYGGVRRNMDGQFEGTMSLRDIKSDEEGCPLPLASQHQYGVGYMGLEIGSVFPMLGGLYCFDHIEVGGEDDHWGVNRIEAFRLTEAETPSVRLRSDTYACPKWMRRERRYYFRRDGRNVTEIVPLPGASGCLHGMMVLVYEIVGSRAGEPGPLAKVGVAELGGPYDDGRRLPPGQWVKVGDELPIGKFRHKVVNIVTPDEKDRVIRGLPCRLVGWIELEAEPIERPDSEPVSADPQNP